MSAPLAEVLLRIAAAVAADGGTAVRKALERALREAAPFDAGEIVFVRAPGEHVHLPLGGNDGPLLGADLVAHVLTHGAPYRVDDWPDAIPFAEAHQILRARNLRSTLVLPFRFEDAGGQALAGVLGISRAHGWAFVGASLPLLVPLAGMAGLAVDQALSLSSLAERVREPPRQASHGEGSAADELRSRAQAAEKRLLEAERARDDSARQASSLQVRLGEQERELLSLRREARARELEARVPPPEGERRGSGAPEPPDPPPPGVSAGQPSERRSRRRRR